MPHMTLGAHSVEPSRKPDTSITIGLTPHRHPAIEIDLVLFGMSFQSELQEFAKDVRTEMRSLFC